MRSFQANLLESVRQMKRRQLAELGMEQLIEIMQGTAARSTAPEASGFKARIWLDQWIERSQPALGGRKPSELLDTPAGVESVAQLLGAIESGAYL